MTGYDGSRRRSCARRARWAAPAPFLITGFVFAGYFVRIPSLKPAMQFTPRVAYLIRNTLFDLLDAARQAQCFRNTARVPGDDGAFVIE